MNSFTLYFQEGLAHILDFNGYDHILFVLALCAVYTARDWPRVLILVTAFTIGHSVTLAMATLGLVRYRTDVIEFLIPLTIFITALTNLVRRENPHPKSRLQLNYLLALFFGLIHGLGFSNYLRALLGKTQSIVSPLFAFNIGLEVGQIIIVAIFLVVAFILTRYLRASAKIIRIGLSACIACVALFLMWERIFW
ncbi:MAG: HupE/UreJ family protein [Cytophagales bacterium]|nr:HupE/UreJ family protein [Cytophagales bacterium]